MGYQERVIFQKTTSYNINKSHRLSYNIYEKFVSYDIYETMNYPIDPCRLWLNVNGFLDAQRTLR